MKECFVVVGSQCYGLLGDKYSTELGIGSIFDVGICPYREAIGPASELC